MTLPHRVWPGPGRSALLVLLLGSCAHPGEGGAPGTFGSRPIATRGPATRVVTAGCPAPPGNGGAAALPPLVAQLEAELGRFRARTDKETGARVHYASARVLDSRRFSLTASLGGLLEDDREDEQQRFLDVTVRVGDHKLDSTHPMRGRADFELGGRGRQVPMPLADDEHVVRNTVWRALDDAYDEARRRYLKVRANALISADAEDQSDDFSEEPPHEAHEPEPGLPAEPPGWREEWRRRLVALSARLRGRPAVLDSSLRLLVRGERRVLVTTEGSRLSSGLTGATFLVDISGRAPDGMELSRQIVLTAPTLAGLPSEAELARQIDGLRGELEALIKAPLADASSGPALLEGRAAAVFFHEVLGHRLEGHRQRDDAESGTFARRLGQPILPSFLNVVDDPTIGQLQGQPLAGCYRNDDEGVPARRVSLVEHGVLRSFLLSRQPVRGFLHSNGHGRADVGHEPIARQGNLLITADRTFPIASWRDWLIAEVKRQKKPYGLRVAEITGGFTQTQRGGVEGLKVLPQLVYRVYPDGRPDELVRGVDVIATPLTVLSHVVAAADDLAIFNGTCGAESGWVPVSASAPSLLIDQLEVARAAIEGKRPPLLPPPADKADAAPAKKEVR